VASRRFEATTSEELWPGSEGRPGLARDPVSEGVFLRVLSWAPTRSTGRPFLLVHGLSSNALLWQQVAEILADAGRASFAVDLRSHGASDAPDSGYTTVVAADDVAAVASHLGLSNAVVVGQSWGGNVVLDLAARHPSVVAGLALVDGGWFRPSTRFESRDVWKSQATPPSIDGRRAEDMRGFFRDVHPDWTDRAIEATMANVLIRPDGTVARRLSIDHHMEIALDMWDSPPQHDAVRVPVVLIPALPADQDQAETRLAEVTAVAASFGDAVVRSHVGDHDLHAQQPKTIAADLLELAGRVGEEVSP
jgi:pimeloyl-ACP methyl ester carboxylesterase